MLHLSEPCVYVHCVGGCEFAAVTSSFKLCPDSPSLEWIHMEPVLHIHDYFCDRHPLRVSNILAFWWTASLFYSPSSLSPSLFICLPLSRLFFHFPPLQPLSFSPTHTHFTAHSVKAAAVNKRSCHCAFDEGIVLFVCSEPGTNYIWRTVWST